MSKTEPSVDVEGVIAWHREHALWYPTSPQSLFHTAAASLIARQAERIETLERAVFEAAEQFRSYERLHLAKRTSDGLAKAETNSLIATALEAALTAPAKGEEPPADDALHERMALREAEAQRRAAETDPILAQRGYLP